MRGQVKGRSRAALRVCFDAGDRYGSRAKDLVTNAIAVAHDADNEAILIG